VCATSPITGQAYPHPASNSLPCDGCSEPHRPLKEPKRNGTGELVFIRPGAFALKLASRSLALQRAVFVRRSLVQC